nr:hypothetical protein [Leuven Picorna-like virus 3]
MDVILEFNHMKMSTKENTTGSAILSQATKTYKVEIKDGKVNKEVEVPVGYLMVLINIATNLIATKGPYWCDIVDSEGELYTTLAVTPDCNRSYVLPSPITKTLKLVMDRVSLDLLRSTYVYVSFTFYNERDLPNRVQLDGPLPLPVKIREPIWTTPRPGGNARVADPEMNMNLDVISTVTDSMIREDVSEMLQNQSIIKDHSYDISVVAVQISEAEKILYSVNYSYRPGMKFTFDTIAKHKRILQRSCPPKLALRNVSVISLEAGDKLITKLQAIYEYKLARPEMNIDGDTQLDELYYEFSTDDSKESWLWEELCSMCGWECIEYHNYRDHRLLVLLRNRINERCKCRLRKSYRKSIELRPIFKSIKVATPEMESEPDGALTSGERVVETSNVILSETQDVSADVAAKPKQLETYNYCTTEFNPSYGHLTDRFLFWKSFQWSVDGQEEGFKLVDAVLPRDFINSRNKSYCNTPNFIPFNIHTYMTFRNMKIKAHCNSNAFQSGGLIMSWLYASDSYAQDQASGPRYSNVALMFQRPHIIISAGASNEATLTIPYERVTAMMRTKNFFPDAPAKMSALNLGRLVICPLVPLATGTASASPKNCNVSLFVSFEDAKFTGLVDGSLAAPEMDRVGGIIGKTLGVVDRVLGDLNCDNPPSTKPASFFVPINSQSWSHGTNAYEPTNTLRLDGGRIGMHRKADSGLSETRIKELIGVFGMLKPIRWAYTDIATNITGKLLWGMGVHPQCDKDRMYSRSSPGLLDAYTCPPVSVISSCMCNWRGSLRFKFQFFCTTKHTARVLCAYIPGVPDYTKITLEQAKSSAHVEFSLNEETNTFTFTVPYIADTEWWQRRYGGSQRSSDFIAPSSIVLFILNPLIPMESVAQYVTIVPSIAAGDDFELSILGQPSIGLALNRLNLIPEKDKVQFKQGYYPVYVGNWYQLLNSTKTILRYGAVSDHIAQLTAPPKPPNGSVYYWSPELVAPVNPFTTQVKGGVDNVTGIRINPVPKGEYKLGFGVIFPLDGYNYMIPIPQTNEANDQAEDIAKVIAVAIAKNRPLSDVANFIPDYFVDSDYLTKGNITWAPREYAMPARARRIPVTLNPTEAVPEMEIEREVSPNMLQPTSYLPTTSDGLLTFGEQFNDIKDFGRRYQLYWEGTVSPGQVRDNKRNAAFVQIPVLPQGLALAPTLDNPVWNSMREGLIPVLSSGFRFYNGGVRFKIVVTGLTDSVWVQHHPDRQFTSARPIIGKDIHDKDAYRNHGYAFHVQNLTVNATIPVEVPWYKRNVKNLLGDPAQDFDSIEYSTLGDIVIGLEGDQPVNSPIDIAVYYKLADDCAFSTFVGFPEMVFCDEVFKDNAPLVRVSQESDFEFLAVPEMLARPEMMAVGSFINGATSSLLGNLIGSAATKGTALVTKPLVNVVKDEVSRNVTPVLRDIEKSVIDASKEMQTSIGKTIPEQAIISALGQFSQVALNPSPASIAIAIVSMLSQFVVVSMELILAIQQSLTNFLTKTWTRYFATPSDLQTGARDSEPEGFFDDMQDRELNGFLGMVFSAVAATVGVSVAGPKVFPNIMKGVKECLNVCNASVVFFRNTVDAIKYMYKYCLGEDDEILRAKIVIEREAPHMKDWFDEVHRLLDPRNIHKIRHSTKHANRVFDACMYGSKLIRENLDKNVPGNRIVYDLYTKLCKMRDDLIELGNHPDVRFEPFPVWISGAPGVGKSFLTNELVLSMLQSIDYETKEMMIYWLTLGQKHWNGVGNNPVIARDEAYAIGGAFTEEEIATHLAVCSSAILNPPMAALSEKNKRLNPLIYWLNANVEFPQISEARCPEAIYRRRKIMARASFTPEILRDFPGLLSAEYLPEEIKSSKSYVQYEIALNPRDPNTAWTPPMSFAAFSKICDDKFKAHITTERANFKQRMRNAYALDPDYVADDDLLYTEGETLSAETLHEQYLRERAHARQVLYAEPPNIEVNEDSYLSRIMDRFSYLWTPPEGAAPEMADGDDLRHDMDGGTEQENFEEAQENNNSSAFYTSEAKGCASRITRVSKLDRGAVLKLVSGGMVYDRAEIDSFTISEQFSHLVKSRRIKTSFGLFNRTVSMLPDWLSAPWQGVGYNDVGFLHSYRKYADKFLPHWEDVSGIPAIRSYVYWMMREWQYRAYCEAILREHGLEEIMTAFSKIEGETPQLQQLKDLMARVKTPEQLVDLVTRLDDLTWSQNKFQEEIFFLMTMCIFLAEAVKINKALFCEHCAFWVEHLHDTAALEYSPRFDHILLRNGLGLNVTFKNYCKCNQAVTSTRIFQNAMRIIWHSDHGSSGNENLNPFSFSEHRAYVEESASWLERAIAFSKDWWRHVINPFISQVLTFLYEHFGKIMMILAGIYGLYTLYNSTVVQETVIPNAKKAYEATKEFSAATHETLVGAAVATGLFQQNSETPPAQAESNYFKADKPKAARAAHEPADREGEVIVDPMHIFERRMVNNFCFLVCTFIITDKRGEEQVREIRGRCLGLRGRQLLVIRHYLEEMQSRPGKVSYSLSYMVGGKPATAFLSSDCLKDVRYFKINGVDGASNFGVLELPKYVPMFKNILTSIAGKSEHHNVANIGHIISIDRYGCISRKNQVPLRSRQHLKIAGDDNITPIGNDIVYEYSIRGSGMCGSLLVCDNVCRGNPGIIGLHVAGLDGNGFSEPIYREMFETKALKPRVEFIMPNFDTEKQPDIELNTNLLVYGTVDRKYAHSESGKTKIIPSLLHGKVYPVKTEPNPLRPDDPRQPEGSHPLRDGCEKHGIGYSIPYPPHLLDMVNHDNRQVLLNKVKNPLVQVRELTLQEAVCGSTAIPHCESLNWNSSEGFPLSSLRPAGAHNKKYLFDLSESSDGYILNGMEEALTSILRARQLFRDRQIYVPTIYIDCLKDYRLPHEKCKIPGKTRIFSIAPVQTTIDLRKYMGCFLSGYKSACIDAQHGIGMNVDSVQWTQLAHYLLEVGNNIVTGDYSNYGPTLSSQLVSSCIEDIIYWHRMNDAPEDLVENLEFILENEIMNPWHLCGDLLYQTLNGIASGSPITAELNSEINKKYVKLAFLMLCEQLGFTYTLKDFNSKCRLVTYGDDFIMSVHDDFIEWFNCETISGVLKEHGIILTDVQKGERITPYRTLQESSFLKRGFALHPMRADCYLAPIEEQSITECLNWCHRQRDMKAATEEVVRASCVLAFGRGKEYYEQHTRRVHKVAIKEGLEADYPTWEEMDKSNFG